MERLELLTPTSKQELQRGLDLARAVALAADNAELRAAIGHSGVAEADVVGHVEELSSQLDVVAAIHTEFVVLKHAEVKVIDAVVACVGQGAAGRAIGEARWLAGTAGGAP